jgi:hypothetical protein
MSSSTPVNFVLDKFSGSYTLQQLGTIPAGSLPTELDVSATAVYYISKQAVNNVFRFETDSWNFDDVSKNDIRYFTDMTQWPSDLLINPVNAMMDKSDSGNAILNVGIPNRMLVKHDFIRYLSSKLFNTPNGVDLFNNQELLVDHMNTLGNASFQNDISGTLWKYSTTSTLGADTGDKPRYLIDASSNMFCTNNNFTSNENICRELFNQILNRQKQRFSATSAELYDANYGQYSLPIHAGDSISYKFTVLPAANQNDLTGVPPFGGRSFRIKLIVVESATGMNTVTDETHLLPGVTYTPM